MFFGWYVVAGGFVAQLVVVGFFTYAVSLLTVPVRAEFGVSLEQVMYSLTAGTFCGMIVSPVAGAMLDRYPVRWLMSGGMLFFAAGMWLLAQSSSITGYVVVFGVTMAVANALGASMAASTVISRWFTSSRGRALGISAMGTSAGGILIPALLAWRLSVGDWRDALESLALFTLLVALPIVALTVRGKPADIGLLPEGMSAEEAAAPAALAAQGFRDILGNPGYWCIGLSLGLLFCVFTSVVANVTPYVSGLGYGNAQASSLIMALAIASLVGKFLFGFVADKVNLKLALWAAMLLVVMAFLLLALQPGFSLILIAICLLGLATGGMLPVWGAMMARVFGLASYGKAMGLMGPVITLSVMPGFALIGRLYDETGNYQLALLVFTGITLLSALILAPLKLRGHNT
jgi:predicted MFS family arabinose efflux permease